MALGDVIAELAVKLSLDTAEFATGGTDAQRRISGLRDAITGLGDRWMQAGKRMSIGVTAPLGAFGILSAKAASDAQELGSAFDQTFGDLAPMMNKWARETGDALGRATQEMQEMANTFGIFFNQAAPTRQAAADMSQTFSVLAQDLASFYNTDPGTALAKLRSGLSGESEPLRDFGVFLNEANVKARALEMGLGDLNGEISEQDKILARYNLILDSTKNAQGDVARTSDSTANQARSFSAAMDELQVVIGTKLLPVLTPLITGATKVINAFTNLPSGVQTAIVAVGALAAAIGPLMLIMGTMAATLLPFFAAKFGPVGLAISAFINPLGTAISLLAQFALRMGALSVIGQILPLLLRFAGPLGLIVSAGLLIYKNWDRVAAVFAEFWARAKEALGPPLQALIATISGAFEKLWAGPLGDGLRTVMDFVEIFGALFASVLGDVLIGALRAALEVVIYVFEQIGTAIKVVNALLDGDFRGAWEAAKGFVTNAITAVLNIIETLAPGAIAAMQRLYTGVKTWLQTKLGAVFDWVQKKVEMVENGFAWLYDRVVGNSWIPDMVDEVGQNMARLDTLMVDPARKAANDTDEAFRTLASNVSGILDRLFPQVAALKKIRADMATIEKARGEGMISDDVAGEAERRLRRAGYGLDAELGGKVSDDILNAEPLTQGLKNIGQAIGDLSEKTKTQTVRIAESFKDMAEKTLGSIRDMVGAIKGGGFLDILQAGVGLFMQLGGSGVFGKGLATKINAIPAYANGTGFHPGGLALVGERGPELVSMPRGAQVTPNNELGRFGGRMQIELVANNNGFGAIMRNHAGEVVAEAAPGIMQGGSQVAQRSMSRRQSRRVA